MPTGTVPPFVMRFDAGGVPVGNLVFSSKTRSIAEVQDAALFRVRPLFATLPGVSAPPPFGSSQRTIVIHADPAKLRAYNMSPVRSCGRWVRVTPSAIRERAYRRLMPMVPVFRGLDITELNNIPIRSRDHFCAR
jgi:hypothetical protein